MTQQWIRLSHSKACGLTSNEELWGFLGLVVEGWRAFQMFSKRGLKPDRVSEYVAESVYSADMLESTGGGEVE